MIRVTSQGTRISESACTVVRGVRATALFFVADKMNLEGFLFHFSIPRKHAKRASSVFEVKLAGQNSARPSRTKKKVFLITSDLLLRVERLY